MTYNLLLRIFVGGQQVNSFHVTKINVMSEKEDEEQFTDILLFLISIQSLIPLKLVSNIGQFLVYPFDFSLFAFTWRSKGELKDNRSLTLINKPWIILTVSDVTDKDSQTPHPISSYSWHRSLFCWSQQDCQQDSCLVVKEQVMNVTRINRG